MKIQNVNIAGNVNPLSGEQKKSDPTNKTIQHEEVQKSTSSADDDMFIKSSAVLLEEALNSFFEKIEFDAQINNSGEAETAQLNFNNFNLLQQNELTSKIKKISINFPLQLKGINSAGSKTKVQKEDILFFVKKIIDKVIKIASDKNKRLNNVVLEQEDLDEILGYKDEKGKLILYELIQMALELARARNAQKNPNKSKLYDLVPERGKKIISQESDNTTTQKSWLKIEYFESSQKSEIPNQ